MFRGSRDLYLLLVTPIMDAKGNVRRATASSSHHGVGIRRTIPVFSRSTVVLVSTTEGNNLAIDSMPPLFAREPGLDVRLHARELATVFALASRERPP